MQRIGACDINAVDISRCKLVYIRIYLCYAVPAAEILARSAVLEYTAAISAPQASLAPSMKASAIQPVPIIPYLISKLLCHDRAVGQSQQAFEPFFS